MTTALLIIALQNGLHSTEAPLHDLESLIQRTNRKIAHFRSQNEPIIFLQHEAAGLEKETAEWQLFANLDQQNGDYKVAKYHYNAFFQTELHALLEELHVDALEIIGAKSDYCIDTTIRFAHGLGYRVHYQPGMSTTCAAKGQSAETIIAYHEALWQDSFVLPALV